MTYKLVSFFFEKSTLVFAPTVQLGHMVSLSMMWIAGVQKKSIKDVISEFGEYHFVFGSFKLNDIRLHNPLRNFLRGSFE
jgi:hypothetical protein